MAVSGNDFEGGTNGAVVNTASIASSGYGFRVLSTPSGGGVFTTDSAHGSLAVAIARSSNTWFLDESSSLNTADISFSLFFRYKTALPNDNDYLCDARTAGGSLARILVDGTTHKPFLQVSGTVQYTGGTALVVNTWYRLDVRIHVNSSSGSVHADFYTVTGTSPLFAGASFSGSTGSSNIVNVAFGAFGANAVTVGSLELDDPRFDPTQSSSYLGPVNATNSGSATLTQSSTLSASSALVRNGSAALTQISILANGPAVWDDYRYVWDDTAISWDDNTVIAAASLLNTSTLVARAAQAALSTLTNDSILMAVAYAYSGDLALLVGVADLEWTSGNADAEWLAASVPSV